MLRHEILSRLVTLTPARLLNTIIYMAVIEHLIGWNLKAICDFNIHDNNATSGSHQDNTIISSRTTSNIERFDTILVYYLPYPFAKAFNILSTMSVESLSCLVEARRHLSSFFRVATSAPAHWFTVMGDPSDTFSLSNRCNLSSGEFQAIFQASGFVKPWGETGKTRFQEKKFNSFIEELKPNVQPHSLEVAEFHRSCVIRIGKFTDEKSFSFQDQQQQP